MSWGLRPVPESWYRLRRRRGDHPDGLSSPSPPSLHRRAEQPVHLVVDGAVDLCNDLRRLRTGLMTGFLSVALLILVSISQSDSDTALIAALPAIGLYIAFVLLATVIRRLLEDAHRQAGELAEATESAYTGAGEPRGRSTWRPHPALEDISAGRLNAVEVAADTSRPSLPAFRALRRASRSRGRGGSRGPGSRGVPPRASHPYQVPLSTVDTSVGKSRSSSHHNRCRDLDLIDIEAFVQPVSIAFANLQPLQHIVGSAVAGADTSRQGDARRHRALAGLAGLALDMAAMQQADHAELSADLKVLRTNVTKLVEDVRPLLRICAPPRARR